MSDNEYDNDEMDFLPPPPPPVLIRTHKGHCVHCGAYSTSCRTRLRLDVCTNCRKARLIRRLTMRRIRAIRRRNAYAFGLAHVFFRKTGESFEGVRAHIAGFL